MGGPVCVLLELWSGPEPSQACPTPPYLHCLQLCDVRIFYSAAVYAKALLNHYMGKHTLAERCDAG